jgi:hypothetical protein
VVHRRKYSRSLDNGDSGLDTFSVVRLRFN